MKRVHEISPEKERFSFELSSEILLARKNKCEFIMDRKAKERGREGEREREESCGSSDLWPRANFGGAYEISIRGIIGTMRKFALCSYGHAAGNV